MVVRCGNCTSQMVYLAKFRTHVGTPNRPYPLSEHPPDSDIGGLSGESLAQGSEVHVEALDRTRRTARGRKVNGGDLKPLADVAKAPNCQGCAGDTIIAIYGPGADATRRRLIHIP